MAFSDGAVFETHAPSQEHGIIGKSCRKPTGSNRAFGVLTLSTPARKSAVGMDI